MSTLVRGRAVLGSALVPDAALVIEGETIVFAGTHAQFQARFAEGNPAQELVEHDGVILPGLVDIHNHGGGGWSYPDTTRADDALPAIEEHRRHGSTSIVASLVTASQDTLRTRVQALATLCDRGELAGIHLEGPFISTARKGAHDPQFIAEGDAGRTRDVIDAGRGYVVTMTVAPEADRDGEVTRALIEGGALPSYGHTDCSGTEMIEAVTRANSILATTDSRVRNRRPTATHLFNAMRPIHHRDAGPAFAAIDAAARGDLVAELIADGVHTSADTVAYTFDLIGEGSLMLITDAMAATGMADGSYRLGSLDVNVAGGIATLVEGGAIAGGTAHLLDVVRFSHQQAGVDLVRAVRAASFVPASVLGIADQVGELREGLRADLILADSDLRAERVMRKGIFL